MKTSTASILLFIALVGFLFYADTKFKSLCTDIIAVCDDMEDKLTTGDQKDNLDQAMNLFSMIEEKGDIAAIYTNHVDFDQILNESIKLSVYIQHYDSSEAAASLHLLKYMSQHMRDIQTPKIQNIF